METTTNNNLNNIIITKMTEEDLNSIKDNLTTEFDDFWNYNLLQQEFLNDTSQIFIATSKKEKNAVTPNASTAVTTNALNDQIIKQYEILGFISIQIIIDEATITNIVTKKDSRNTGIGSAMLDHIINYCKTQNLKNLTLEVNEKNTSALNLYKKYNFKQTGLRKNYYNGNENAIIMNLSI